MSALKPQIGQRPSLEFRPLGDLQIDPAYQRSIDDGPSHALVKRIATSWNWTLCQPLAVARRDDGTLYVIDGQHRLAAARMRGDIYDLPCVISPSLDQREEAETFVKLSQQRRPLSAVAVHRAAVASGDQEARAIDAAICAAGLGVAANTNPGRWPAGVLSNIGGLQRCYRNHGERALRQSLLVLSNAFAGQVLRFAGTIFPGIAAAIGEEGAQVGLLSEVLAGTSQQQWRDEIVARLAALPGSGLREAAADVVRDAYREAKAETEEEAA